MRYTVAICKVNNLFSLQEHGDQASAFRSLLIDFYAGSEGEEEGHFYLQRFMDVRFTVGKLTAQENKTAHRTETADETGTRGKS